jgi:hypothetical protein
MNRLIHIILLTLAPIGFVQAEPLNFNRDIRPILSAKCFACHGPDSQDRAAKFRLDTKEGAFADLGGYAAIVPRKPDESELVTRITSTDPDELMPPPEQKNPLTAKEIGLLKRWIKEGAPFSGHWAFEPVTRPTPPATGTQQVNVIDRFIEARLQREGLPLSPAAAPATLLRRVYLDLTGLPPTLAEVDAFLRNPNLEAAIDRLMKTPQFAERLAQDWLDVARFADSNGYSIDDHRDMWGWRDWVIHAFQTNLRYDDFIHQQLAGDLMKNATASQQIATGFLRNSMNTHEGGTIAEEYRVARIADQIDTVSTAFLGLTMKCAQCHDHKYDPISQRDYYRFFAFFNTTSERGTGAKNGNTKPFLGINPILQNAAEFRKAMEERIAALEFMKAHPEGLLGDARQQWERDTLAQAKSGQASTVPSFPFPKPGEAKGLSWIWANSAGTGEFAWFQKTFSLATIPDRAQLFVSCDNEAEIWINGKPLGKNPDWRTPSVFDLRPLLVEGENLIAVAAKDWSKGEGKAALVALASLGKGNYLGTDASWTVSAKIRPRWNRVADPKGFSAAAIVAVHGAGPWGPTFAKVKENRQSLIATLRRPEHERSAEERNAVIAGFAKADPDMDKLVRSIDGEIDVLRKSIASGKTTVMVMDEAAANRKTPMLVRGAYDQHGETVTAGIPAVFGSLPTADSDRPPRANRLALANWLTDPANPLTARVTVNRYWQMLFGTGLVKTAEDFGSQGEWPSHPELLDWLAANFVASGWDLRQLLKTMLHSRTYRQTSDVAESLVVRDPYNRLLARAPRYRLAAESVRDGALAIGGLLDLTLGGPSVYPPQPTGLWKEVSHFGHPIFFSAQHFYPDRGRQVYRRSLYTFWKRTSPPPVMTAFDAPNRETCTVRRDKTNTPLQALALMNAPQFVEASRGLAQRMLRAGDDVETQIRDGFRRATARNPSESETRILRTAYERQLTYFGKSRERVAGYLNGPGNAQAAALTSIASLILNLDETITRE